MGKGAVMGWGPWAAWWALHGPLGCRWDLAHAGTVATQKIELDFTVGCLWTDFSVQAVREFSEGIIVACIMLNSPSITGANQYITNPT